MVKYITKSPEFHIFEEILNFAFILPLFLYLLQQLQFFLIENPIALVEEYMEDVDFVKYFVFLVTIIIWLDVIAVQLSKTISGCIEKNKNREKAEKVIMGINLFILLSPFLILYVIRILNTKLTEHSYDITSSLTLLGAEVDLFVLALFEVIIILFLSWLSLHLFKKLIHIMIRGWFCPEKSDVDK